MPYTVEWLESAEAADQRMVERKPKYVIHFRKNGLFSEFDCESRAHARNVVHHWMKNKIAEIALIRSVDSYTGMLGDFGEVYHHEYYPDADPNWSET